jgi:ABC-type lipoprotein release transport system permease subunit
MFLKKKLFEKEKLSRKILRILLKILIGIIAGLFFIAIILFIINFITPKMYYMDKDFEITIEQQILNISYNISNNTQYQVNIYDCKNYSRDLKTALENIGLKPYCVTGITTNGSNWGRHEWIELNFKGVIIPIEATAGYIISNEEYDSDYKITDRGFCY